MRTWTANLATAGVRNSFGDLVDPAAVLTVATMAPLVFLLPGGAAVGAVRAVRLADGAILATGTANDHGVELIEAGVWVPEVDFNHLKTEPVFGDRVVIHKAEVTRVVLGQLPLWEGCWITLDGEGAPP